MASKKLYSDNLSLSGSIDLVANSITLINPDGSTTLITDGFVQTGGTPVEINNYYTIPQVDAILTDVNLTFTSTLNYIDAQDDLKLNITDFNATLGSTLNYIDTQDNLKLNITDFNTTLQSTLDYISGQTVIKLNIDDFNTTLTSTLNYVDTQDNLKLNIADFNTNIANYYTKTETDTQIANLVDSAPATLDTLNELASALGDDPNFATTVTNQIALKANQATTYTKTEVDESLALKADQATTYTKTEVDDSLLNKIEIVLPTPLPTMPYVLNDLIRTWSDSYTGSADLVFNGDGTMTQTHSSAWGFTYPTYTAITDFNGTWRVIHKLQCLTSPPAEFYINFDQNLWTNNEGGNYGGNGYVAQFGYRPHRVDNLVWASPFSVDNTAMLDEQETFWDTSNPGYFMMSRLPSGQIDFQLFDSTYNLLFQTTTTTAVYFNSGRTAPFAYFVFNNWTWIASLEEQGNTKTPQDIDGGSSEFANMRQINYTDLAVDKLLKINTNGYVVSSSLDDSDIYNKTQVDDSLALKADQATTYTKTEVDDSLALKADQATTYTKTEVDDSLALKANQATTYTKSESDGLINVKANTADTFLKTISGNNTILTINSKFRVLSEGDLRTFRIQYYDDDGAVITDSWVDLANFIFNTDTNTTDLLINSVSILGQINTLSVNQSNITADVNDRYTKAETDTLLDAKANQATTYSKTEVDDSLALKANQATTYTKTEVDDSLSNKIEIVLPTPVPTMPYVLNDLIRTWNVSYTGTTDLVFNGDGTMTQSTGSAWGFKYPTYSAITDFNGTWRVIHKLQHNVLDWPLFYINFEQNLWANNEGSNEGSSHYLNGQIGFRGHVPDIYTSGFSVDNTSLTLNAFWDISNPTYLMISRLPSGQIDFQLIDTAYNVVVQTTTTTARTFNNGTVAPYALLMYSRVTWIASLEEQGNTITPQDADGGSTPFENMKSINHVDLAVDKLLKINTTGHVVSSSLDDSEIYSKTDVDTSLALKADQATTYSKTDVDNALGLKADLAHVDGNFYNKTSIDSQMALKADQATTYTKTDVDTALGLKADLAHVDGNFYNKTSIDSQMALKADQATTYTKTEVDNAVGLKANTTDTFVKTVAGDETTMTMDSNFRMVVANPSIGSVRDVRLQYYDDDGTIITDSYQTIAQFKWDTDINQSNIVLSGTFDIRNEISQLLSKTVDLEKAMAVSNWKLRVVKNGGTIDPTHEQAYLSFVGKLMDNGAWSNIYRINAFIGTDSTAALTPLKNDSGLSGNNGFENDVIVNGTVTYSTGFYGDGVGGVIDTGLKLSWSSNGYNIMMGIDTFEEINGRIMGVFRQTVADRHYIVAKNLSECYWGGLCTHGGSTVSTGVSLIQRDNTGEPPEYFRNNVKTAVTGDTDLTQPSDWSVVVCGNHGSATGDANEAEEFWGFSTTRVGGYVIGVYCTDQQMSDIYTAFTDLNTALSRT